MDLKLTGKRALVTGSSSGIGRGVAAVLAREGAVVLVHGRERGRTEETAGAIRAAGGTAHIAMGDLATDEGAASVASAGGTAPPETVPDYCAAKAGIINMSVSLSKTLARTGVTVNTVSPGCTRTEMFERKLERMAATEGWPGDYESREARFMDLGIFPCASARYGRPEELGSLVAFLASPLAAFANGANYRMDGGQCQSVN